jgi:ribosomal protein S18 acetylase RimI-like enzyme
MVRRQADMNIIRATITNLEQLSPLVDAYGQFYKRPSNLDGIKLYLQEKLSKNQCVVFMAFEGQDEIGFTLLYPHYSTAALGHVWLLNDLFTKPEARRKGVGEALLNHAADFAKADGAKRIWLRTAVDNFTAQALYEKMGYKRDEQFYRYDFVF